MSHVELIEGDWLSLPALAEAAAELGGELDTESRQYKWYGTHVGDYPVPVGFSASEMGTCDVAEIRFPGAGYSIGVSNRRDGQPGYVLQWDFWDRGKGLQDKIGDGGSKFRQAYAVATLRQRMASNANKYRKVQKATAPDGTVQFSYETDSI